MLLFLSCISLFFFNKALARPSMHVIHLGEQRALCPLCLLGYVHHILYPRKKSPTGSHWVTDGVAKEDGARTEADLSRITLDLLGR